MNSFYFRGGWKCYASCPLYTILFVDVCGRCCVIKSNLPHTQHTRVHFCSQHWLLRPTFARSIGSCVIWGLYYQEFKGSMSWTLIATITIGFFVGLATLLVARMPMTRAPRQWLTGWVAHLRPNGCPEMTWGRTLKKALKCKGLQANFTEWRATAEDRSE